MKKIFLYALIGFSVIFGLASCKCTSETETQTVEEELVEEADSLEQAEEEADTLEVAQNPE